MDTVMNDVGVRLASAFTDEADAVMKAIMDNGYR
jgi:hypothetical protein